MLCIALPVFSILPLDTYAEIILPLAVRSNFHYRVDASQQERIAVGQRVLVGFGKQKVYTGVVRSLSLSPPRDVPANRIRYIEEILDETPLLSPLHLQLFDWIAFYYACTLGEVFKVALPSGLKPESALRVRLMPDIAWQDLGLDSKDLDLLDLLAVQSVLTYRDVMSLWDLVNPMPRLRALEARHLIQLSHEIEDPYKPRFKTYLRLSQRLQQDEEALREAFDSLAKAPVQENLLMYVVSAWYQDKPVPKTETLKSIGASAAALKALIDKDFLIEEDVRIDRLDLYGYRERKKELTLTPAQETALASMRQALASAPRKPLLLHGITGSGKTHLYIELMREVVSAGRQVLYLLPEITLTKQIIDRVRSEFGAQVGVYHSRFNEQERVEIWQKVHAGEYQIVIGVRSAVFLPFPDLGMIVVDEEHDGSFKQYEPAPRYHARDVAVYYGQLLDIPVILGSATPAFETYHNALQGKYHFVELHQRALEAHMPRIEIVDMRVQRKKKLSFGIFSNVLEAAIGETLARGEQIILFQNRRGYAPFLVCKTCGYVPQCINCDISLTYHKEKNHLRCHYCSYTNLVVDRCENCGNYSLRKSGVGTEKIAESAAECFPHARIQRMDLDTTRGKSGYQHIISQFENKQIDILVGTQMVSKGLDFEHVTLVGVIHADQMLNYPDFRAYEHAYQLLTQVSGRAGRSQKPGHVIIQTYDPDNAVLQVLEQPYATFFHQQLPERQQVAYPPFTRLFRIELRHKDHAFIEQESIRLHNLLKPVFGPNLLGPDFALIARVRNVYRMQFLLKIGKGSRPEQVRRILHETIEHYFEHVPVKTLQVVIDVDPV
ncbi:MAG: primosomal protein N' [Bacteroidia bacterium]